MVAGGVGLAPFVDAGRSARARAARRRRCSTARARAEELFYLDCFERARRRVVLTTEDGSPASKGRVTAPLDAALAADARRPAVAAVRLRPDADDARRRAARRDARPRRARCRSSRSWAAAWAAATAASCSPATPAAAPHFVRSCIDGPVFDAAPHRLGRARRTDMDLSVSHRLADAQEPADRRQRLLRLRRRVRRRRRPVDARRRRRQGPVPGRARRAPAAAHRRDAGRHAQRDRPAGHRRAPLRRARSCPSCATRRATVIVNICGTTLDEYVEVARILSDAEGVAAIELNISCPNIKEGGITFGCSLTGTLRRRQRRAQGDDAAGDPEADAERHRRRVVRARRRGRRRRRGVAGQHVPRDGHRRRDPPARSSSNIVGGLSGPAIRPIAVRMVYECRQAVKIPIIGMGGIADAPRRARVHDRRRHRGAGRHGELRRSVHLAASCSTACSDYMAAARHQRGWPTSSAASTRRRQGTSVDQLLVALDVDDRRRGRSRWPTRCAASSAASRSAAACSPPKGPAIVRRARRAGDRVFLDLKFHDIPNTVASAVAAATPLGVWMVNVHASGGAADDAGGARRRARDRGATRAGRRRS